MAHVSEVFSLLRNKVDVFYSFLIDTYSNQIAEVNREDECNISGRESF
jgi:hypothetical protein